MSCPSRAGRYRLGQEGIITGKVGMQLEHVGDLVTEEREQDRAAADAGDAIAGRSGDMHRVDVPMTVTVYVDEVRAEGAVRGFRELAVVAEHGVQALVVARERAAARHVLDHV